MSFAEDCRVEVRYPLTGEQEHGDRAAWPWLPGWVVARCGPDEREICVQAPGTGHGARGGDGVPGVLPGFLRAARPGRRTGGRAVTTWNDPPGDLDPRTPEPRPFLTRLMDAIFPPPERDPNPEYDGPCVGGTAPEAGS